MVDLFTRLLKSCSNAAPVSVPKTETDVFYDGPSTPADLIST